MMSTRVASSQKNIYGVFSEKLISNTTHYAKKLGLEPELQTFYSWADHTQDRPLTPSRNQQLDLFMDGGVTAFENDLIEHLRQQRWQSAQGSYQRLNEQAPTHIFQSTNCSCATGFTSVPKRCR